MAANDPVTITPSQIQYFAELILEAANQQTEERMVSVVNDSADHTQVPTAKAIDRKVSAIQKYTSLIVASGDPADAEDLVPNEETMYMVRKAANSTEFVPYIWIEGVGFITMPMVESESSGGVSAITNAEIASAVSAAASAVVISPSTDDEPSSGEDDDDPTGDDPTSDDPSGDDPIDGD